MKNILAIIPARSGSKSIPNKNVLDFCWITTNCTFN